MVYATFEIVVGLLLLVGGGEVLLRGAVGLAQLARLTPAVIGLTVVAAGTSIPELAVSATAAFRGSTDIAVGNVVGSNLFNIAFILGLAALIRPLVISGVMIRREYPLLVAVTAVCLLLFQDGMIGWLEAGGFVAAYVAITGYLVVRVRREVSKAEMREFESEVEELTPNIVPRQPRLWVSLLMVVAGATLLALGASATVDGASTVGRSLGLTERVIGLTIVAAGTGLPEVVTSLVSSIRGRDDVAIANVIGSNLFNILGILGINGLIAPLPVAHQIAVSDAWWMMGVTVLLFPIIRSGRIDRWEGLMLLGTYVAYIAILLARTA